MNGFKRYPAYKDSGVEWLGEVPEHWPVEALKHNCNIFPSNVDKKSYDDQIDIHLCNYTDVYYNEQILADMEFMPATATLAQIERFGLRAGDVIFTKDSESPYDIAIATYVPANIPKVVCGYHLSIARAGANMHGRYIKRFFDSASAKAYFAVTANGLTRVGLGQYAVDNIPTPRPPLEEQTQIARFLDHETARIDALIEEQQRLIELLKEKRQAVISHAVTKGLDPTVPMKDSGVEWLGEVPAHWVVSQLKFNTLEMQTGPFGSQLHAEDYIDGGIPLVNPAHMINGKIIPDPQVSVDKVTWERLKRHALSPGEIIFARRGELGRCAIVTNEQSGWLCGTGSLKARLSSKLVGEYAYLLITSRGAVAELSLESKGSTMENLNTETLGRIRLPLPPVSEQKAILEYVHDVAGQFEALVGAAETGIRLITERRSALISAAVTGKIDVRGWQPPEAGSVSSDKAQQSCSEAI